MSSLVPEVCWGQSRLSLFFKIEVRAPASDISDFRVACTAGTLDISYKVNDQPYALKQALLRSVVPDKCRHSLTGRTIVVELTKKRPSGWKRPFALAKPKWLKTWFDRWDDNLVLSDASGSEEEAAPKKPAPPATTEGLRAAIKQVEVQEREMREQRQKELELSLRKGEKPPPREEVKDGLELDSVD